jgi:hypothetical protein
MDGLFELIPADFAKESLPDSQVDASAVHGSHEVKQK